MVKFVKKKCSNCPSLPLPIHALKTYRRRGNIFTFVFNHGTRWIRVVSLTPQLLYSRERASEPVWVFPEETNHLPIPGFKPRNVQPVA